MNGEREARFWSDRKKAFREFDHDEMTYATQALMGIYDALEDIRAILKDIDEDVAEPKMPSAQQWIPVTERLPEIDMACPHHDDYLVQYDSGDMDVASWSNVNRFWTDHVTSPHWNCVQFATVVAWMPLPEPYREEDNGRPD